MKNSEAAFLIAAIVYAPHVDAQSAAWIAIGFFVMGWVYRIVELLK